MKKKYITITGCKHYYGLKPFALGKKLKCVKEKDNAYDQDAICVVMKQVGTIGYVANSPYTVITGTNSAGRIYGDVKKTFTVKVKFITAAGIICQIVDGWKEKKQRRKYPEYLQELEDAETKLLHCDDDSVSF